MNAERLLDAFNRLGDEPDTVQQFRKLVVGLAMSGKLVAPDEAALAPSNLLNQIEAKKRALVQQGVLRKQNPLNAVSLEDLPKGFTNPSSFVRLGEIARIEKGQTGIMKAEPGAYPLVVTAEERGTCDHFDFDGSAAIVPLVSSAGHGKASLQRLHYQEGKFALGSILAAIFPHAPELISARFLFEYLTSFKDELLVSQMIGTANVSLSVSKVADVPVPLVPPLVQRKVDELMGLCDRLEAARAGRERSRDRLAAASLARLNAPDPETFHDDARFALGALPALTTRPDQIKALRQTILNLAVRGKLVPQDANDEPIAKRYQKELGGADVPASWRILNFGKFCDIEGGNQPPKSQFIDEPRKGYVRLLQIRDLGERPVPVYIPVESARSLCKEGEILIGRYGASVGKVFWAQDGAYNVAMAKFIWPDDALIARFAFLLLKSQYLQGPLAAATRSAQAGFNKGDLAPINFPLPPLAEQHRIVAKVDALMALCDRLEASLAATAATRRRLLDALLAEALAPVGVREMEAAE